MFTLTMAPNHYECSGMEGISEDVGQPFGVAFASATPPGPKITVKDADKIITGPSVFESRRGTAKIWHRNCSHVKVEGDYVFRGSETNEPYVTGMASGMRYFRSDATGIYLWFTAHTGSYKTDVWVRPFSVTDSRLLLQLVSLYRADGNQYDTVRVSCIGYVRGKTTEDKGGYTSTFSAVKVEPCFDVDFKPDKFPDLLAYITKQPVDLEYDVDLWECWDMFVDWTTPFKSYDEWDIHHDDPIDPQSIINEVTTLAESIFSMGRSIDPDYSSMRDVAANDAISHSYCNDSNALEFFKDLDKAFVGEMKEYAKFLTKGVSIKQASKAYLATHYGTNLTASDYKKWSDGLTQYMWRNKADHYAKVNGTREYEVSKPDYRLKDGLCKLVYGLYYDPHWDNQSFDQITTELGLKPTYQHVWEVIPFSFCVDWFYNISADLQAIQSGERLIQLDVHGEEVSTKYAFEIEAYPGLYIVLYIRTENPYAIATPQPSAESMQSTWRQHGLEGAALILSH